MEIKIPFSDALYEVTDEKTILDYRAILSRDSLFYGLFSNGGQITRADKIDVNDVRISNRRFTDKDKYNSVVIAFNNPIYTFVQGANFDKENAIQYIDFTNHLVDPKKYQVYSEYVVLKDLWVVYAIPKRIQKSLKKYLGKYNFTHYQVCNLKSISSIGSRSKIHCSRVGEYLNLTFIQDSVLELSNSYAVRKESEFYYFLCLIFDQYKLESGSTDIYLQGDFNNINVDKLRFQQLFGTLPVFLGANDFNTNETSSYYKPLLDLNKCESSRVN